MCGIFGKLYFKPHRSEKTLLLSCVNTLAHRGPDDAGYYEDENIFLGSRRLSIIDISRNGHMPMSNKNKNLWITFNGEIYNYLELKKTHLNKQTFKSNTDTEVVLYLYEKFGPACLTMLRGMFAFAIWDSRKKELFLARDHLGKKPLKFFYNHDCFMFASELKALFQDPVVPKKIDPVAIDNFLTYQYVPAPLTGFKNIFKLKPAHYMLIKQDGRMKETQYWKPTFYPKINLPVPQLENLLLTLLKESVKIRLRSDVNLGAHLSGGIDSSLIVALMAKEINKPVKTFSVGFEEKEFNELSFARAVASKYKTDHHEIIVKPKIIEDLPGMMRYYEEPFADASMLPTWLLCSESKKEVTVALNGDGADENFAGYMRYNLFIMSEYLRKLPFKQQIETISTALYKLTAFPQFRHVKTLFSYLREHPDDTAFYARLIGGISSYEKGMLFTNEFHNEIKNNNPYRHLEAHINNGSLSVLERLLQADIETYLSDDLLVKIDIAGMAHSLEVRSPFLDQNLIEFAAKLHDTQKIGFMSGKRMLRNIAKNYIPSDNSDRKKHAFNIPLKVWIGKQWRPHVQSLLENKFYSFGILNRAEVKKLIQNKQSNHNKIWTLIAFKAWLYEWFS